VSLVIALTGIGDIIGSKKAFSLLLNVVANLVAFILIYTVVMPMVNVEKTKSSNFDFNELIKVLAILCLSYGLMIVLQLFILQPLLDILVPQRPVNPYDSISPTGTQVYDPVFLLLYFGTLVIAAPLYEELAFRRVLIPMLEDRGMSPGGAAMATAIIFASAHTPNDLINGNLRFALDHFFPIVIIGFAMGAVYIYTRNVIYPMIMHGIYNGISALATIGLETESLILGSVLGLIILTIIIVSLVLGGQWLYKYLQGESIDFIRVLSEKTKVNIFPGFIGFIVIFLSITAAKTILSDVFALFTDGIVNLVLQVGLELGIVLGVFFLITNIRYTGEGYQKVSREDESFGTVQRDRVQQNQLVCDNCGSRNPRSAMYCKECGRKLVHDNEKDYSAQKQNKCDYCGTLNPRSAMYCKECGRKL